MALDIEKDVPVSPSLSARYWRIGDVTITPKLGVSVQLLGYLTQEDRDAGATPIAVQGVSFAVGEPDPAMARTVGEDSEDAAPPVVADADVNAVLTAVYEAVKQHPAFVDATDV